MYYLYVQNTFIYIHILYYTFNIPNNLPEYIYYSNEFQVNNLLFENELYRVIAEQHNII